jgi:hypothetical protein
LSFPDDHASPAAPFFGDETGEIFETPDLVFHSPTTTERVVDTQSGFLVVVKRVDSRLALSVKRRLGTPPVSSILLTPDESLKLSRILAGPVKEGSAPQFKATPGKIDRRHLPSFEEPDTDDFDFSAENFEQLEENGSKSSVRSPAFDEFRQTRSERSYDRLDIDREEIVPESEGTTDTSRILTNWDKLSGTSKSTEKGTFSTILLVCLLGGAVTLGAALASIYFLHHKKPVVQTIAPVVESQQVVEARQIDKLARDYVTTLLDFNPATYRYSQVRAMATMTPDLMARYWKETHFPLSLNQLKAVSRNENVVVAKVEPQPVSDPTSPQVDVYANMVGADGKANSSVHLRLSLEKEPDGVFKIFNQEDLSSSSK